MAKQTITLNVTGNKDELVEFVRLCGKIQSCGVKGVTKTFTVTVDGDGSGRLMFALLENNIETQVPTIDNNNPYVNIGE